MSALVSSGTWSCLGLGATNRPIEGQAGADGAATTAHVRLRASHASVSCGSAGGGTGLELLTSGTRSASPDPAGDRPLAADGGSQLRVALSGRDGPRKPVAAGEQQVERRRRDANQQPRSARAGASG